MTPELDIVDQADGIPGRFNVRRGAPHWDFYNAGRWSATGEVFIGRRAAEKALRAARVGQVRVERVARAAWEVLSPHLDTDVGALYLKDLLEAAIELELRA